jgi:hypothetical protein
VCACLVLRCVYRTQQLLLRQTVSIGDRRLTAAHRRRFRVSLCRAVLHMIVKTFATALIVTPFWVYLLVTGSVDWRLECALLCAGCVRAVNVLLDHKYYVYTACTRRLNSLLSPYIALFTRHYQCMKQSTTQIVQRTSTLLGAASRPTVHTPDDDDITINSENVCELACRLHVLHTISLSLMLPVDESMREAVHRSCSQLTPLAHTHASTSQLNSAGDK